MRAVGDWDDDRQSGHYAIWLGNFNRHHQHWDNPSNTHLFTTANVQRAKVLTQYLDVLGFEMALPLGVPMLEHMCSKNLMRPDNVFCTKVRLAMYHFPINYQSCEVFDDALTHLMAALHKTIEEQVPLALDTPYAKRWWLVELTKMCKEKEWLVRLAH
ncbi:hypothetical protein BN946_scf184864.g4 [Trametes cinnabarina]|uniref:Endonuclease/exonuclease/phosphatase domain-containing protein n=1 Tax=Pycnoporus cinnabarinus TaxID=5643 RepID=A0A060SSE4_PYCCI|nr:hypothetical protein BN946_scf184864.g4 [Trametes cinnabarina]